MSIGTPQPRAGGRDRIYRESLRRWPYGSVGLVTLSRPLAHGDVGREASAEGWTTRPIGQQEYGRLSSWSADQELGGGQWRTAGAESLLRPYL
jgi:hypothetical protein